MWNYETSFAKVGVPGTPVHTHTHKFGRGHLVEEEETFLLFSPFKFKKK